MIFWFYLCETMLAAWRRIRLIFACLTTRFERMISVSYELPRSKKRRFTIKTPDHFQFLKHHPSGVYHLHFINHWTQRHWLFKVIRDNSYFLSTSAFVNWSISQWNRSTMRQTFTCSDNRESTLDKYCYAYLPVYNTTYLSQLGLPLLRRKDSPRVFIPSFHPINQRNELYIGDGGRCPITPLHAEVINRCSTTIKGD